MRIFLIVLDGVGIGALPDAGDYGDEGSHTLLHVGRSVGRLRLPNLERLGLGRLVEIPGVRPLITPEGARGRLTERLRLSTGSVPQVPVGSPTKP